MKKEELRKLAEVKMAEVIRWDKRDILSLLDESLDVETEVNGAKVGFNIYARDEGKHGIMVVVSADSDLLPLSGWFPVSTNDYVKFD